jgi:hypothetical protein
MAVHTCNFSTQEAKRISSLRLVRALEIKVTLSPKAIYKWYKDRFRIYCV